MPIKISELNVASTPLTGNEVIPIVQSGETKKVDVSNLISKYSNVAYVDPINGNNSTAQVNNFDKPFLTIQSAVTACESISTLTGPVLDPYFDMGNGANGGIAPLGGIALQSDGKAILAGDFTQYNYTNINRIVRINTNGSIDNTFIVGTGFNGSIGKVILQPDNTVIAVGNFTNYNGVTTNRVCKLYSNGSIDGTFSTNIGSGANGWVYDVKRQADGKLIITGEFTSFNGTSVNRLTRLNADGTVDTTFQTNIGTAIGGSGYVTGLFIKQQSDEKILLAGFFTTFNSVAKNRIVRLNTDGTIDATFNMGTGFNGATWVMEVLSNDKILIGGEFTSYNGFAINRLIKLNSDGTRDTGFNIGTGFENASGVAIANRVMTLNILSDGKILVGGSFFIFNGVKTSVSLLRINSDGSRDLTYPIKAQANGPVRSVAVRPTGQILIGGNTFTDYDGIPTNNFAQLVEGKIETQLVYVKRGAYYLNTQITLKNRVDIYCEPGVFLYGWVQIADDFLPVIANFLGYARISSTWNYGSPGVFFIYGPSYVNIEFDEINTDTQLVRSFISSSRNQINVRGNRVQCTTVDLGAGIALRNAGNLNLTLREYFRAPHSMFDLRANTGTININIPNVVLQATGYYSGNEKQVFYLRDAASRRGKINFVGNIEVEDFGNPGGINGVFRFFNNATVNVSFKGNINSRKIIAIALESGSSTMVFEGGISTEHTAINVFSSCTLHLKNSNIVRTTDTVAGPISIGNSGTLYINDSTIYSSFLDGNIINVGATTARLYMKNVQLEGVGTNSCVNVSTFTASTVGLVNVMSNKPNSAGFVNAYSTGSFLLEPNLNVPKFIL